MNSKLFQQMNTKKWLFILIILVLLGAGGRWGYQHFFPSAIDNNDYISNEMPVEKGDVVNLLMMNGKAKFSNMQKLIFPQSGKIVAVYKKVGDLVKAGEIIAKMDSYEVDNELEQAKIGLENEQRTLKNAEDTSKKELEIMQADKKYQALLYEQKNAGTSLKLALQTIENEYINKKNDYVKLLSDYEKKTKEYDTKKKTYDEITILDKSNQILYADEILKTRVEDFRFTTDSIKKELDSLDKVMLYTTKYGTTKPDYYIYIGAKNQTTKTTVERLYWEVSSLVTTLYDWANKSGTLLTLPEVTLKSELIQHYEKLKELAEKKTELNLAITSMMDANLESVSVTLPVIAVSDGRSLKETANKNIDEILGLSTPETIGEKRKKELDDLKLEIDKMKQAVDKAQIEYNQLDTDKAKKVFDTQMDFDMKDLQIQIAKKELDDLKSGDSDKIQEIKNAIKQKQKTIETIMKKYENYVLKANFDGVITKMTIQVGDTIGNNSANSSTNEEKMVYIENPNNLEIQVDVDQSDITKLSVGMPVQIKLDALVGSAYTGTLAEIDTTAGDSGGGYGGGTTNYKAKIVFLKKEEDTILGSMTATVTIILQEAHDVLIVPNIAISNEVDGLFVMKIENGKYKKTPIKIGIADQANTEILSGVVEGDTIMGVFIDKDGIDAAGLNEKNTTDEEMGGMMAE